MKPLNRRKKSFIFKIYINTLQCFKFNHLQTNFKLLLQWSCWLFYFWEFPFYTWQAGMIWTTAGSSALPPHFRALPTGTPCAESRDRRGRRATRGCQGKLGCRGGTALTTGICCQAWRRGRIRWSEFFINNLVRELLEVSILRFYKF